MAALALLIRGVVAVVKKAHLFKVPLSQIQEVQERDSRHAVAFMRPHLVQSLVYVAGIVLASVVLIASQVFFCCA